VHPPVAQAFPPSSPEPGFRPQPAFHPEPALGADPAFDQAPGFDQGRGFGAEPAFGQAPGFGAESPSGAEPPAAAVPPPGPPLGGHLDAATEPFPPGADNPFPLGGPSGDQSWLGASVPPRRGERSGGDPSGAGDDESTSRSASGSGGRRGRGRRGGKDGDQKPQTPAQAALSAVTEVVVVLAMALGLSLLIKTFLVQAFYIPSQSMEDTLLIGDRVLVSKLTPGPLALHHGDVIVFKDPGGWLPEVAPVNDGPVRQAVRTALTFVGLLPQDSGEHLIKRVIGLPGDKVVCCDAKGRLTVNGTPIDETYVRAGNAPSQEKFSITVKPDNLWVMGDNRSQSEDSRFHQSPKLNDGQVPMSDVVGKAFVIVWPFNRFGGVVEPPDVFAKVPAGTAAS
jgi:signal peptidase I